MLFCHGSPHIYSAPFFCQGVRKRPLLKAAPARWLGGGLPGNRGRVFSQKSGGRRSFLMLSAYVLFPMRQAVGLGLLAAYRSFLSADGYIYKPGSCAAYADIAILFHTCTLLSVINLP